jgi:hypothetical protein
MPEPITIKPKTVKGVHRGHTYILTYNPQATGDIHRWSWVLHITRKLTFTGHAASESRALIEVEKRVKLIEGE